MTRRQRLQVLHSRMLRWGIGVSVLFHAGVLAFGHLNLGETPAEHTAQQSLTRVLNQPIPTDRAVQLIDLSAVSSASESAKPAETSGSKLADLKLTSEMVPTPAKFSEAAIVLAKATVATEPTVPAPHIVPETVESGITPIRVIHSGAIVFASDTGRKRRGGGIRIMVGGGHHGGNCPETPGRPGMLPARVPSQGSMRPARAPGQRSLVNNRRPRFGGSRGTR